MYPLYRCIVVSYPFTPSSSPHPLSLLLEIHIFNIVHFDLKPQNVLLEIKADQTFKCVICDFGFATVIGTERVQSQGQGQTGMTQHFNRGGVVKGLDRPDNAGLTTQYAAPEVSQRRGIVHSLVHSLVQLFLLFSAFSFLFYSPLHSPLSILHYS